MALDGTGPALLPLDAALPAARLTELIAAFQPDAIEDSEGVITTPRFGIEPGPSRRCTAVIIGTSGSTGTPKGVELSAAALLHSARASLARVGARPAERWLCCLPVTHVAGLQVLVRSLASGTEPVLAEQADARTVAGLVALTSPWSPPSCSACWPGAPARRRRWRDSPRCCWARPPRPPGLLPRRPGRGRPGDHDLRHDRDLRRLRVRRGSRWTACRSRSARTTASGFPAQRCSLVITAAPRWPGRRMVPHR